MNIISSCHVCIHDELFTVAFGVKWWLIGIKVYPWGIRLMLIWWHACFHFPERMRGRS